MKEHDLIPRQNAAFDTFQSKIIKEITTHATDWNISGTNINPVTKAQGVWVTTWAIAKNRKDCTTAQRKARNVARTKLEAQLRPFIKRYLHLNPLVTSSDKSRMGLKEHDYSRHPAKIPETVPTVEYKAATGHQFKVHCHQEAGADGVTKRGMPEGVGRIEITYAIDITPAPAAKGCNKVVSSKRNPFTIGFDAADAGKPIILYARWVNTRNEPGKWNEGTETIVP